MNFFHKEYYIYLKFFLNLFTIINPISMIPIFSSLTSNFNNKERTKANFITNFSVLIILCISLFLGNYILKFFNISIEYFQISGGILITTMAYSMIQGNLFKKNNLLNPDKKNKTKEIGDFFIVPVAMPLIAGPGAISSTIIWSAKYNQIKYLIGFSIIILFFSLLCWFLFKISPYILNILGTNSMSIITRIMGLFLMSLGIQLIISGIKIIIGYHI